VGYSEVHPPITGNPNFVNKSTERSGLFADVIAEMDSGAAISSTRRSRLRN
jgi:hypothetical protein